MQEATTTNNAGEDSVDRIAAAWHAAIPTLPLEPLGVFTRIIHIARIYERAMAAIGRNHSLSLGEVYLLLALRRAPKPMTLTELRLELFVTAGAVSKQVDRLRAKRLIKRRRVATDARIALATLTASGRRFVDDVILIPDHYVFRAPLDLAATDRTNLIAGLRKLTILFELLPANVL